MPHRTAVILVVGLNQSLITDAAPKLKAFARRCDQRRLIPPLPAVTCSAQSSMLTGVAPSQHGIVGNGWYNAELSEVQFWKQSNKLVQAEKVWETARKRDASVTCANICWWYNMYSSVDYSVTPRPIYKADGRKIPDCHTHPPELRNSLQHKLGTFPLFKFWGPLASIESSKWIADAAQMIEQNHEPTLSLVYLPHLDYALQKFGPDDANAARAVSEIDAVVGELIAFYESRAIRVMIVSEYGIEGVDDAVHINRVLREAGGLCVREEQGLELLDAGASEAFAVADHQIAHVYVKDAPRVTYFQDMLRRVPGVEQVLDRETQQRAGLNHTRSGDLVLVSEARRWFSYDYWLDDAKAPDFARTVDIHRKPGYDPLELFIDPAIALPKFRIARKLLARKLGFRTLLDVIPLDTRLVRGSHGRVDQPAKMQPVLLSTRVLRERDDALPSTVVRDVILDHLFGAQ